MINFNKSNIKKFHLHFSFLISLGSVSFEYESFAKMSYAQKLKRMRRLSNPLDFIFIFFFVGVLTALENYLFASIDHKYNLI